MNPSRVVIAFGAVYTLVCIVGFTVSTTLSTANLIVFPVNVLHTWCTCSSVCWAAVPTSLTVSYARGIAILFAFFTVAGFLPQPLLGLVPLGGSSRKAAVQAVAESFNHQEGKAAAVPAALLGQFTLGVGRSSPPESFAFGFPPLGFVGWPYRRRDGAGTPRAKSGAS